MADAGSSLALQFFEGAIWSAARNLLQAVLSLIALAVVAREIGPEAYGVFGIAMLVVGIAEMVAGGALTEAIVQRKDLEEGHIDATFWLSTGAALLLATFIVLFAAPLAHVAGSSQATDVLFVLGCLLPLNVGSRVPTALLVRDLRFRTSSQLSALATMLSCGTGIFLALHATGIWTLVAMEAVRSVAILLGTFLAVSWRPGARGRLHHLSDLWRFNAGMLATYSVGYADLLLPRLLVSQLLGPQALGLFMLAVRVFTELSNLLTRPLHAVAMAACARAQDTRNELQRIVLGLYRTSRLVVFPVFLGMAAIAPWLIPLLFGPKWNAAVPAVQLLMVGAMRSATGAFNSAILLGVGQVRSTLYLFAAGCALHLVLFPLLAPWGVAGAALAMLGRQFGNWPLACVLIRRATGIAIGRQISGGAATLAASLLASGAVLGTAVALQKLLPTAAVVAAATAAGALIYVIAMRVLSPATLQTALELVSAFVRRDRGRLEATLSRAA
jgi:O-antigen/teichoic acid export membrane protein